MTSRERADDWFDTVYGKATSMDMISRSSLALILEEATADLRAERDRLRERIERIRKQTTAFSPSMNANKCALCGYYAGDHFSACPMEEDVK